MSFSGGRLKEHGASVLAAIVLVAVLGAVFVALQYARSMGSFAYAPTALTATADQYSLATGETTKTDSAPTTSNTGTCDYKTQSCSCSSDKKSTTSNDGSTAVTSATQQCLPGCTYTISAVGDSTGGNSSLSAKITTSGMSSCIKNHSGVGCTPASLSAPCSKTYLSVDGKFTVAPPADPGGNLAVDAIKAAPDSTVATGLGNMYKANNPSTDPGLQYLQSNLGGQVANVAPDGSPNTSSVDQNNNANAALQAMAADHNTLPGPESGSGVGQQPVTTNPNLTAYDVTPTNCGDPTVGGSCDCPTGYSYSGGSCVLSPTTPPAPVPAPTGCVGDPVAGGTCDCPTGYSYSGGSCVLTTAPSTFIKPTQNCIVPGQVSINGNCTTPPPAPAAPEAPAAPAAPAPNLGNLGSGLTSFLTGLMQGMNKSAAQQAAQAAAQQAAQQAAANSPYGTGTDGMACPQPQQQPAASSCTVGTWQQQRQSNNCPTYWSCVSNNANNTNNATQPSASLSCQPQTANIGMTVTMSYSCTNATGSSGSGFNTNSQLSGSATASIAAPSAGTNSTNYILTCTNQSLTASAQCAVQINQPSIALVASPNSITSNATSTVGWVTSGMQSCVISSPNNSAFTSANASNTSANGVAVTPVLTSSMTAVLSCQTAAGGTMQASTLITVGTATSTSSTTTS